MLSVVVPKPYLTSAFLVALACGSAVFAQPAGKPTIGAAIDREISLVERQVVGAAEAMPEEKFNFSPENLNLKGAEFKGVYSFAGLVKHLAAANYFLWSGAAGEQPPAKIEGIKGPAAMTSKADIVALLKESFGAGHHAAQVLTPDNATDDVPGPGGNQVPRIFALTFTIAHAYDEYAQMVEYLRMNGIVPPASAPRPQTK